MDSDFLAVVTAITIVLIGGIVVAFSVVEAVQSYRTIQALKRKIIDLQRFNLRLNEMEGQLTEANQQLKFIVRSILEHTNPPKGDTNNG